MPSVILEGSSVTSENDWKKNIFGTLGQVSHSKNWQKKSWEKFPIQKLWHCDTIILCQVSHWKGPVSHLKIIEKNIFGTLGQVSHSKNWQKKIRKNSQFKNCDTVTPLFYAQCHVWKWLKKIFLGHCDQCPIRKIKKKTLVKSLLTGNIRVVGWFVTSKKGQLVKIVIGTLGHLSQCPTYFS